MTNTMTLNNKYEAFELNLEELEEINGGWNPIEWLKEKLFEEKAEKAAKAVAVMYVSLFRGFTTFQEAWNYYDSHRNTFDASILLAVRTLSLGSISAAAAFAYIKANIEWFMKKVYEETQTMFR